MKVKKGISLIILVITIIVMIIIASAIILSLDNANIMEKATGVVESYNIKSAESIANEVFANFLADNEGNIDNFTDEDITNYLNENMDQNITQKYDISYSNTKIIVEVKQASEEEPIPEDNSKLYLYNNGVTNQELVGSFIISKNEWGTQVCTQNTDNVYFETNNTKNNGAYGSHIGYITNNKIDTTGYDNLVAVYENVSVTNNDNKNMNGAILIIQNGNLWTSAYVSRTSTKENTGTCTLTLPLTNFQGEYNISAGMYSVAGTVKNCKANLKQLYLEKSK